MEEILLSEFTFLLTTRRAEIGSRNTFALGQETLCVISTDGRVS